MGIMEKQNGNYCLGFPKIKGMYFLNHLMDMGSLFGTIIRTIPSYKRDPYVRYYLRVRGHPCFLSRSTSPPKP